jgi:excisionase family DNA binding protein
VDAVEWLSTKRAAWRMGVTPRTLYRLIDDGLVPAYRMGRVLRLRAHEVDAAIEAARVQPGSLSHLWNVGESAVDEADDGFPEPDPGDEDGDT